MDSSKKRFIEAATRSLSGNAESRARAVSLLEQSVACTDTNCDDAVARWDAVDGKTRRFGAKAILYLCLMIVSGWMLADGIRILIHLENMTSCMCGSSFVDFFHNSPRIQEEDVARELSDPKKMLLFGDLSRTSKVDRMKGLWDSDPGNPGYFVDYAYAYSEEKDTLPPDFLETARRIDPDNAWFTYIAAGEMAIQAVKTRPRSKTDQLGNIPPEWEILDAAALERSLKILREARGQPRCENPLLEIQRERAKLLPTRTPTELVFAIYYRYQDSSAIEIKLRALGPAIAAKAWLCGKENDPEAFRNLVFDANHFLKQCADSEVGDLLGEMINTNVAFNWVESACPVANQLGLNPEAAELESAWKSVKERKALRNVRKRNVNSELIYDRGGELAAFGAVSPIFTLIDSPRLSPAALVPGRLMDHETVAWTGSYFVWAIFIVAMGVSVGIRRWQPPLIQNLANRLELLLLPRDWIMIVFLGIVIPITYFIWITRFTPWGGREWSVGHSSLNIPFLDNFLLGWAQQCALGLLVILSVGAAGCRSIRKRARPLGLVTIGSASLIFPILSCAAFIPIRGWQVLDPSHAATAATSISGGITVVWLLLIAFRMKFGSYHSRLRHAVAGRILVPCFAFAALVAISSAPIFKHLAFQWSAKDTLVRMDKDFPAGTEFQHRVALQYRQELRQTLGYKTN